MRIDQGLRRMFERWGMGRRTVSTVTLWDVFRTYASESELAQIRSATPDRRMLVGAVARFAGTDEGSILRELCRYRGFDYVDRIPPADFTLLNGELSSDLLHGYGATVITEDERVVALATVDPDQIDEIRVRLKDVAVVVARWDEVHRHLDESTRTAAEVSALRIREATERLRETTEAVLSLVVHDVLDRGLSAVTIDLSDEDSSYAIVDDQGRISRGSLHPMLRPALKELLASDRIDVLMPSGTRHPIEIVREHDAERFNLSWTNVPIPYPPDTLSLACGLEKPCEADSPRALAKMRKGIVFVIDDNPGFREIVGRFLERHGFDVRALQSAEEAWSALEEGAELDVIVCDVHMPGMDGYDFVRRLRATTAGRGVPLIALTSDDGVETEIQLIRAGVSAFVSKSADPRVLCAHVERWCDESKR